MEIQNRKFGLDLLRSIAILLVFFGHGAFIYFKAHPNWYNFYIIDGVDVFFVLSGFLIGYIYIKNLNKPDFSARTLLNFLLKRWIRTIPNYLWILTVITILSFWGNIPFEKEKISWQHFLFIQNLISPHPKFFPEAWSLAVEEWFYLIFPIGTFIMININNKNVRQGILLCIIVMIIIPILYKYYKSFQFDPIGANYDRYFRKIVIARLDSLALGVLAAFVKYYYRKLFEKYKYIYLMIGISGIILLREFPAGQYNLVIGSFLLSLFIFFTIPWFDSLNKSPKYIGSIVYQISLTSYSLYLIHFSLILIPIQNYIDIKSKSETTIGYIIYLLIAPTLAHFNYKYFEKPILRWRDKTLHE
jgi:peptidoglycan/LPS O-acetylase OafA/YrhL